MKKTLITVLLIAASLLRLQAQESGDIVKTGLNFGPLPAIAYDADKGFQYGAILQIYNYGDGHNYPNYNSKIYLEYSRFTKGSQLIQAMYDEKELIPNVRWSSALRIDIDKAFDFYGFNGYETAFDQARIDLGKAGEDFLYNPFYRMGRNFYSFKSDFIGKITNDLRWEAGIFAKYYKLGSIDLASINKGKDETQAFPEGQKTLYDIYKESGVLSEEEADGGFTGGLRLGLVYDTRDKEGAPSKGIWAEGHITAAPGFISETPYYRYSFTWRQYVPIIKNDVLTFAYRLNYEGSFTGNDPFYAMGLMTSMGEKNDYDAMGGYNTCRGIMRTRINGLDMALYNAELRWRFVRFSFLNQNIALGLSAFTDGTMVTRTRDISALKDYLANIPDSVITDTKERPHITTGGGFRFIMNENFIVAVEYGTPISHFMKNSPVYNQDGTGCLYINLGYVF